MVIHEKLFVNFIHNGVTDTNSVNNLIAAILKAIIILLIGTWLCMQQTSSCLVLYALDLCKISAKSDQHFSRKSGTDKQKDKQTNEKNYDTDGISVK